MMECLKDHVEKRVMRGTWKALSVRVSFSLDPLENGIEVVVAHHCWFSRCTDWNMVLEL